jgi:hypothetical protein
MKVKRLALCTVPGVFGGEADARSSGESSVLVRRQLASSGRGGENALSKRAGTPGGLCPDAYGKKLEDDEAGEILLGDGDEIAVFPPVAGG